MKTLENKWQQIETAPRDGTAIMVIGGEFESAGSRNIPMIVDTVWTNYEDKEIWTAVHYYYYECSVINPTHWMPIPNLPEKEEL